MIRVFIGIVLGSLLLFLFLYFGGPGYLESFGEKAEQAGKNLKPYELKARDAAQKVGERYEDIKKRLEPENEAK
jgi:hypothetical protein